jgi:hypothetical protein
MLVSTLGVKRELASLILPREASLKKLEGVRKMARRRTSPRRSGDDKNAERITLRSAMVMQIKAKNRNRPNYNGFSYIEVIRVMSSF